MRAGLGRSSPAMLRGCAGIHGSAPIRIRYRAWSRVQQWCPEGSNFRPDDQARDLYARAPARKLKMKSRKAKPRLQDWSSSCDLVRSCGGITFEWLVMGVYRWGPAQVYVKNSALRGMV